MSYRPLKRLNVAMEDIDVGTLELTGKERSPEQWRFTYNQPIKPIEWLGVSWTMPVREEPYEGALVHNWFTNLLPEGAHRLSVCAALGIPVEDTFTLLGMLAHECAGKVQITPSLYEDVELQDSSLGDMESILYLAGFGAADQEWAPLGVHFGSCLAGAQDKLAVIRMPGGRFRLRERHELTTHILKPEPKDWPGLRDLEAFGQRLAARVGLTAAACELVTLQGRQALLVERFDRVSVCRHAMPLHQEDMCQLLGYPSTMKYQQDHGPSFRRLASFHEVPGIGEGSNLYAGGMLLWAIYCALLGNADAHGKNISLTNDSIAGLVVAPLYDLVPTIAYPESLVDRVPAMAIGNARRIDQIDAGHWAQFAQDTGWGVEVVASHVKELGERMLACIPSVLDVLEHEGANGQRLRQQVKPVVANIQRMLKHLPAQPS